MYGIDNHERENTFRCQPINKYFWLHYLTPTFGQGVVLAGDFMGLGEIALPIGSPAVTHALQLNCWLLLLLSLAAGLLLPRAFVAGVFHTTVVLEAPTPPQIPSLRLKPDAHALPIRNNPLIELAIAATVSSAGVSAAGAKAVQLAVGAQEPSHGLSQPADRDNTRLCEAADSWPSSRLPQSVDDWVFAADGASATSWSAQFRFSVSSRLLST